jgi:beta-glucosidase
VFLKPGEKQTVTIPLNQRAFAFYDPAKPGWVAEAGDYQIQIGSSSRDLRLEGRFQLRQTVVEK